MTTFKGVMPALLTPLTESEKLNVPVLQDLIAFHLKQGAYGFYVGGASGEGFVLDRDVRVSLAYESVKAADHRVPVIVHVAAANVRDAILLAKEAEKAGADAISAIPPVLFQYGENEVFNYYKAIASAVHIPLVVYYNKSAGFDFSAEFAAKLYTIDNATAIKWSCSDYYGVIRLKNLTHGEMTVLNGPDEMLLQGLSAGADGGIGLTYNFQLPTFVKIYESFQNGDSEAARRYQTDADRKIYALLKYPCIPATKAVVEKMGFAVGNASFPMKRFTDEEKERIFREVSNA